MNLLSLGKTQSVILHMDMANSVQRAIHIKQNIRSKMFWGWGIKANATVLHVVAQRVKLRRSTSVTGPMRSWILHDIQIKTF